MSLWDTLPVSLQTYIILIANTQAQQQNEELELAHSELLSSLIGDTSTTGVLDINVAIGPECTTDPFSSDPLALVPLWARVHAWQQSFACPPPSTSRAPPHVGVIADLCASWGPAWGVSPRWWFPPFAPADHTLALTCACHFNS